MKKFITTFLLVFIAQLIMFSQTSIAHRTASADAVIEGKVVSKQSEWNDKHTEIFTKNIVEVYKVFKGTIRTETITVVTSGGVIGNDFQIVTHSHQLGENIEGVFFLQEKGNKEFRMLRSETPLIKYKVNGRKFKANDGMEKFTNPRDIYFEIENFIGNAHSKLTNNSIEKSITRWLSQNLGVKTVTDTLIEFTFENIQITGGSEIEFDIMAKSNQEGIKFAGSDVFITYSVEAFGSNAVANQRIEGTKETVIENTIYSLQVTDEDSQTVKFLVNAGFQPNELYSLSLIGEKFLHVKLDVENIYELASISFDNFLMSNQSLFYDEVAGEFVGFDKISVENPIFPFLMPNITMLSPTSIPAGVGDELTITGQNFGNFNPEACDKCKVKFADGDEEGGGEAYAEGSQISSWTDQEIVVKVPSATNIDFFYHPAASGGVWVERPKLDDPDQIETSNEVDIHIPYSVFNLRFGSLSTKRLAISNQVESGILFNYNSNVPVEIKGHFEDAVSEWCSKTGVAWKISNNTLNNDASENTGNDGVNIVTMVHPSDFDNPNARAAVVIKGHYIACGQGSVGEWYIRDIDVKISNDFMPFSQSDNDDWYNYILHELGHAHGLNHSVNPSISSYEEYIMNASANSWVSTGKHSIQDDDILGANTCFPASQTLLSIPGCTDILPISTHDCGGINSLDELSDIILSFGVSPNPLISNEIIVNIVSSERKHIDLNVTDILGQQIHIENIQIETGENVFEVKIPRNLTPGTYFVSIKGLGHLFARKIIKI